jgi:hypothetical protein
MDEAPRLADYVATLERRYAEKVPGYEATIRKAVRQSASQHGREVFGVQAYERIQQENWPLRLFDGYMGATNKHADSRPRP